MLDHLGFVEDYTDSKELKLNTSFGHGWLVQLAAYEIDQ